MRPHVVKSYLDETKHVEGWFFPIDALLFAAIDEIQKEEGIAGNLFEIGVHHGKTALFLARMLRDGESLGVCDVFGEQALNVDHSGEGSLSLFLANLGAYASRTRVFAKLSSLLTTSDTTSSCRFFHIDGGHRPLDVMGDLAIAAAALLPDGVVAVDDMFNPSWPGVSEGVYRFLAARPGVFAPLLIGGNKVLFTRPPALPRYETHFASLPDPQPYRYERKEWLGRNVLVAGKTSWEELR